MISAHRWVCTICGDSFTRRSSAIRHNGNLHAGNSMIVRPFEYMIGRQNGTYTKPNDPLSFRKNKNKKTHHNNGRGYPVYSHETFNNTSNPHQNYNIFNTHRIQKSHPHLDLPFVVGQQKSLIDDRQSGSLSKQSEKMSNFEKLVKLKRLLFKYYTHDMAQALFDMIFVQVFFGDETCLVDQLKLLLDLERTTPE
jgi:hypothetical protein